MISQTARPHILAAGRQRSWTRWAALLARLLVIIGTLALLGTLLVAALPRLWGYQSYVIYGSSMEPTIKVGSLILTEPVDVADLQVRDIIAYLHNLRRKQADITLPGDAAKGAALYQDAECATCHVIQGQGGRMGPQLTDIGTRRSSDFLRAAIAAPQTNVPLNWRTVHITTANGQTFSGRIMNEDGFSLRFMDQYENLHALLLICASRLHKWPSFGVSL